MGESDFCAEEIRTKIELLSLYLTATEGAIIEGEKRVVYEACAKLLRTACFGNYSPERLAKVAGAAEGVLTLLNDESLSFTLFSVYDSQIDDDYRLFAVYFCWLALLQFTKSRFNGILIGADRVKTRREAGFVSGQALEFCEQIMAREVRVFPKEGALSALVKQIYKGLGEPAYVYGLQNEVIDRLLIECEKNSRRGALAELVRSGYLEGLKSENKNRCGSFFI